jgi:peroxiredoxin
MTPSQSPEFVAGIALTDPDGNPKTLGEFGADPLVVILVRYFGCLPCQEFVRDLDGERDRFPAGTRVIAVGGSADHQARWLRDTKGVEMPLLLDPDQEVRAVAGVGDLSARQMSSLGGATNYVKSLVRGFRPQVPTHDATKAPGIVVFDSELNVAWVHHGEMLGDYPPVDDLIDTVRSMTERD